ncbi:MAG: hypothetical protein ACXWUP_06660 [Allosphingosinicella sp.]
MPTRLIIAYAMLFVMAGGLAIYGFRATRGWRTWRRGRRRAARERRLRISRIAEESGR